MALRQRHGDAFITTRGFECMVEILYRAARLGLRISEVPMVLDGSRRVGKSKMKVFRTSVAYLGLALRALTGRL
jgi:dolichol-phosphate mannosyltransferase